MTDTDFATDIEPAADDTSTPPAPEQLADVRADRVEIVQGGAESVTAETVTISQGGAGRINATELSISQGGFGLARATKLSLNERSFGFAVLADEATFNGSGSVFMLIARTVSGTPRAVIDWRAAAAFGAAFAVVMTLLRRVR